MQEEEKGNKKKETEEQQIIENLLSISYPTFSRNKYETGEGKRAWTERLTSLNSGRTAI